MTCAISIETTLCPLSGRRARLIKGKTLVCFCHPKTMPRPRAGQGSRGIMSASLLNNLKWFSEPDTGDLCLINHTIAHGTSFLAAKILEEEHDQKVCQSVAGYYIGSTDSHGEPVARDSVEYWGTEEEATKVLKERSWTQRLHA